MKKNALTIALTLFFLLVSTQFVLAQAMGGSGGGNMSDAAAKLEKMSATLQLTPAQKEKIKPILMEEAPKLKALKSDTSAPPLQKAMSLRKITEDTDAKLQPILSPAQYQKLQQMQAEERQQMMQKMENR